MVPKQVQEPALLLKLHQCCPERHSSLVALAAKPPQKVQGSIPARRFPLRGGAALELSLGQQPKSHEQQLRFWQDPGLEQEVHLKLECFWRRS